MVYRLVNLMNNIEGRVQPPMTVSMRYDVAVPLTARFYC